VDDRLQKIADCVIGGRFDEIKALVESALSDGVDPQTIVNDGLRSGMQVVGDKFKANEFFVPEVLTAARAMKAGMEVIKPHLAAGSTDSLGTVVIGTVQGDLHDIGKNLVAMMLEGAGFQVIDLGADASPEAFVDAARENNAELVAMSALLTTTMGKMAETIYALNSADLGRTVRTMIGGAPVTQTYANEIGADAYAPEAATAVDAAKELVGRTSRRRPDGPPCWPQRAFARRLEQERRERGKPVGARLTAAIESGQVERIRRSVIETLRVAKTRRAWAEEALAPALRALREGYERQKWWYPDLVRRETGLLEGMRFFEREIPSAEQEGGPIVVAAAMKGEVYGAGKDIVAKTLSLFELRVVDAGVHQMPEQIAQYVLNSDADAVCICLFAYMPSAVMLTGKIPALLARTPHKKTTKTVLAGYGASRQLAAELGFDGYAGDGAEAARVIEDLCGGGASQQDGGEGASA